MSLKRGLICCCLAAAGLIGVAIWKYYQAQGRYAMQIVRANADKQAVNHASNLPGAAELIPMPPAILAFNTESNETTVTNGYTQVHFRFTFTNISDQDVTITDVHTSCGCTTADVPALPWTIPPRHTGEIPVVMGLEGETGRVMESVTVVTLQGQKQLTVVAVVTPAATNAGMMEREHN